MTFEFKLPKTPSEVVFVACAFLLSLAGLQKTEDQTALEQGAAMLKNNTSYLMRICVAVQGGASSAAC